MCEDRQDDNTASAITGEGAAKKFMETSQSQKGDILEWH
jgi:hypothetical protein